jgi:D-methionine transport system substrate-binding protein
MDSANIPRSLDEFDYAVIPGSVVYSAGIDSDSVLLQEDVAEHLLLQVVVNEKEKDSDWAKAVVNAYQSEEFTKYMEENNKDNFWYIPKK